MDMNNLRRLDVTLYGKLEQLTDTLSKCRVRIFYKGFNRNRTFISDSFANQLINSLPYAPVKGIFNKEDIDFDDHGVRNSDGQIYGIVAANPNFAWEEHEDIDGVTRLYACADVILYTALYPEANLICGKSQSMEIHKEGLKGEWKKDEFNQPYFEFYEGHLLGLQVLGDVVEPCFEGSAFFSLYKDAKDIYDYIKNSNVKEESKIMENEVKKTDVNLDNNNAEGKEPAVDNSVDNSATKPAVEPAAPTEDFQAQIDALTADKAALENTVNELKNELEAFKKKEEEEKTKCAKDEDKDKEDKKSDDAKDEGKDEGKDEDKKDEKKKPADKNELDTETYEKNLAEKDAEIARLNSLVSDINNEKSELEAFKKTVEAEKKEAIIDEFSSHFNEEQIGSLKEKMDSFSVEDFKKEVCFAAYNADSTVLNHKTEEKEVENDALIYKNNGMSTESGALALLRKYKGGN